MKENPFTIQRDVFDKLLEQARRRNLTRAEEERYFRELDVYSVNMGVEEYIRNEAREKGLAEGRAEGLEQGIEEGAYIELSNNVRSMRNAGLDDDTIARFLNKKPEIIAAI